MHGESLWPRLAELSARRRGVRVRPPGDVLAFEFDRITTHVQLVGAGADGLGEDVSVSPNREARRRRKLASSSTGTSSRS